MKPDLEIIMSMLWHLNVLACYTIEKPSPLWSPDATVVDSETFFNFHGKASAGAGEKISTPQPTRCYTIASIDIYGHFNIADEHHTMHILIKQ